MFEKAARMKLRFDSKKGPLTIEDLWDLPLESTVSTKLTLNSVAILAHQAIKASEEVNFVRPGARTDETAQLRMDIIKHIIDVRKQEIAAVRNAAEIQKQNQKIMEIIDRKGDQALENADLATLQSMIRPVPTATL